MNNLSRTLIMIVCAGVVSGCASVRSQAGFRDVQKVIGERTGLEVHWLQGVPEDAKVAETIHSLLQEPLTVDAAVQIALLNHPALQATFEELGIAQADLVQAGLLQNPIFSGHVRFPDNSSLATNTEFAVTQDFLDILFLPLRKKLASMQFKQAKLRVSDAVLSLSSEVKSVYYTLQASQQMLAMRQTVFQATQAAAEMAERQHKAGNISTLDLANEQALYEQMKVDLAKSEAEVLADRERLSRFMGLENAGLDLKIAETLPDLPHADPPLEELETLALSRRLDLAVARQEMQILRKSLTLTRVGVIPTLEVGVDTERDADRTRVTGPAWELSVPLFDQRQAAVSRIKAQLRQSEQHLAALERDARSEVRLVRNRLLVARHEAESYRDTIVPLREKIVADSLRQYNYMLIGVFQLLQAKQNEINARRDYIEALKNYWIARSNLERAVGGEL